MNSRPDAFMPLWIADYLADTAHLTCEQHGAYLLLLMAYWRRGGPLPDNPARLAAITKTSPQKWRTLRSVMLEFFVEDAGTLKNKRADEEIAKASHQKAAKVAAGKKGAEIRRLNHSRPIAEPLADGQQKGSPSPSPTLPQNIKKCFEGRDASADKVNAASVTEAATPPPELKTEILVSKQKPEGRRVWQRGEHVPQEWIDLAEGQRKMLGLDPIDQRVMALKFVNWHQARANQPRTTTEWQSAFLNFSLSEDKREKANGRSTTTGQYGQPSAFISDLTREIAELEAAEREASKRVGATH